MSASVERKRLVTTALPGTVALRGEHTRSRVVLENVKQDSHYTISLGIPAVSTNKDARRGADLELLPTRGRKGTAPALPNAKVAEAARLLRGGSVVLIGGDRRPGAQEKLNTALNLKELLWIETRVHESIDKFEHYIARRDVALVLLAIRWSSHSFGDVKRYCDHYDKPIVRLPGGYNPIQVAAQILAQCSRQLGHKLTV